MEKEELPGPDSSSPLLQMVARRARSRGKVGTQQPYENTYIDIAVYRYTCMHIQTKTPNTSQRGKGRKKKLITGPLEATDMMETISDITKTKNIS